MKRTSIKYHTMTCELRPNCPVCDGLLISTYGQYSRDEDGSPLWECSRCITRYKIILEEVPFHTPDKPKKTEARMDR